MAVTAVLSLLAAGALAFKQPTPLLGGDTDVRVFLWTVLGIGFAAHSLLSTALLPVLLRSLPAGMAAGLAHAFAAIGAAGAVTIAIVWMAA